MAVFGAIFSHRLSSTLGMALPAGAEPGSLNASVVARLPDGIRETVIDGFTQSLHPIFQICAATALGAFALTFILEEIPLRGRMEHGSEE